MEEQSNLLRMSVTQGSGEPDRMSFSLGEKVGPTSVGASAEWRVSATGVLPVHAHVYYDGAQLFVRSASQRSRVTVDGRSVGEDWHALKAPCSLRMGLAVLSVSAEAEALVDTSDSDETQKIVPLLAANILRRGAPPAEPSAQTNPVAPPATSVLPVEMMLAARQTARQAARRARAGGAPPSRPAPAIEGSTLTATETVLDRGMSRDVSQAELSSQQASKQVPAIPPNVAAAPAAPIEEAQPSLATAFKPADAAMAPPAARRVERSTVASPIGSVLSPVPPLEAISGVSPSTPGAGSEASAQGLVAGPLSPTNIAVSSLNAPGSRLVWVKSQWSGSSHAKKAALAALLPACLLIGTGLMKGAAPRSLKAPAAASVSTAVAAGEVAISTSSAGSAPEHTALPSESPAVSAAASVKPVPPITRGPKAAAAPSASKQKTLQRRAVDAVTAGAYEEAARIYEELAQNNLTEPAYAEAARILKSKSRKP